MFSIFLFWGGWVGPTTFAWSPQDNGPKNLKWYVGCFFCVRCFFGGLRSCFSLSLYCVSIMMEGYYRCSTGQKSDPNLQTQCLSTMLMFGFAILGRFPRRGRSLISSVSRTPKIDPWNVRGSPWTRLSLLLRSLIPFWGFGSHSSWVVGSVVFLLARKHRFFVRFHFAFQRPDPCENCCWVSLSLSLSFSRCLVVLLFAVVAFLFFISLCAGETQTVSRLVVPVVSLRPGHTHRLRPVLLRPHLHQGMPPARVFFFWSVLVVVGLSLSLSLSVVLLQRT